MRKDLSKELLIFGFGLDIMLESISNFANEEEQEMLLDIFNGSTKEGYTQDRYTKLFKHSFDEEVSSFNAFLYDFVEKDITNKEIQEMRKNFSFYEKENIKSVVRGLEVAKKSLSHILKICTDNEKLKEEVISFVSEESHSNIFKEYGVIEFEKKFRGWSRAFQKELKDEIGRRTLDKIKTSLVTSSITSI
jgi:hypothetical protein